MKSNRPTHEYTKTQKDLIVLRHFSIIHRFWTKSYTYSKCLVLATYKIVLDKGWVVPFFHISFQSNYRNSLITPSIISLLPKILILLL